MTPVGLITVAGLVAVLGYLSLHKVAAKVKHLWCYLFSLMLVVTASYQAGLSSEAHFWAYGLPAAGIAMWTMFNFRSWEGLAIVLLFALNIFGNYIGIANYKFHSVDALDVFAWAQIGLLLALARKTPVEKPVARPADRQYRSSDHKRLRLVGSGGLRNTR